MKSKPTVALQADGWQSKQSWRRESFCPPLRAIVRGRDEAIFRGNVEGYRDHTGAPFLKFELETTRHRIAFGIYPNPGDEKLSVADVTHLTPGVGTVKFASGASYTKPNYRTISIVELSPVERLANMTELQMVDRADKHEARRKVNRRNGSMGGQEPVDGREKIADAIAEVHKRQLNKGTQWGLLTVCERVCKAKNLQIKRNGLAAHYRKQYPTRKG